MVKFVIFVSLSQILVSRFSQTSYSFFMGLPYILSSFRDFSFFNEHSLILFSARLRVTSEGRFYSSQDSVSLYSILKLWSAGRFFSFIYFIWLKERLTDQISGACPRSIEVSLFVGRLSYFRNGRFERLIEVRRLFGAMSFYSFGSFFRVRVVTLFSLRQNCLRLVRLSKTAWERLFP